MLCIDKIYLAHYTPLVDRKTNMLDQLSRLNLEAQWIEGEPDENFINQWYSKEEWDEKFVSMGTQNYPSKRQLKRSEISLEYKHIKIYEEIVKNNVSSALILEDDAVLCENFTSKFNFNMMSVPMDWDFIFIGDCCNLRIPKNRIVDGRVAYRKEHPASKCTDSYIIKLESAKKILETIKPFTFPIDFELNYQMYLHDMNVYWWEPPLVTQGSQNGLYRSVIQ
ncbi:MAG TPA: hypothetical protein DEG69_13455 [Flavobacteriaceae bacterium]|jgi:glycosyl transferase family 25|nr:hypothetical protein [Flavobacteriaceae bacterium]